MAKQYIVNGRVVSAAHIKRAMAAYDQSRANNRRRARAGFIRDAPNFQFADGNTSGGCGNQSVAQRMCGPRNRQIDNFAATNFCKDTGLPWRQTMTPFPQTVLAAGATQVVTAQVQRLFKPGSLFIPASLAVNLGVVQIAVGATNQFATLVGEVDATRYSDVAQSMEFGQAYDPVTVGTLLSVTLRNKDALNPIIIDGMAWNGWTVGI